MAFDLSELLKNVSDSGTGREQIEYISLDLLDEDPNNFYQLSGIEELAANIELCKLQQPIRVRRHGEGRYIIVSGHRRRAAVALLAKDDPEKWSEVPCLIESDDVSPALQQLRLIYANASTRKMTDAEISEQAKQIEKLLCQLREDGYEFPGRMRDHVSEIVGISKSKLGRLKFIRENLSHVWSIPWSKGQLNESVAYELARAPEGFQLAIYKFRGTGYLDVKYVKAFTERFYKINDLKCKMPGYKVCRNVERKQERVATDSPYSVFHCNKCCGECSELTSCKYVCPVHATKAAQLRADKRAARKQEIAAEREAERPQIEKIASIWQRFGAERVLADVTVKGVKEAMGLHYWSEDQAKYEKLESGESKISTGTKLPFGIYLVDVSNLTALADLFNCSIDYLLCRTDVKEMAQGESNVPDSGTGWQTGEPINLGAYVVILGESRFSGMRTAIYQWTGERWEENGIGHDDDIDGTILGWVPMPEDGVYG